MSDLHELRVKLLSDFLFFTRFFFRERTGRDFVISNPAGNISHFVTIANDLTDVFLLKTLRLIINCPPGWSKSEMLKNFIAWSLAHYADSRYIYVSYSHDLAASHTSDIKSLISLPIYKKLFGIEIQRDSSAKDFFKTIQGGAVAAFGSAGAITGRDAGLPALDRFSGALCIDDIHKPDEVHSDTIREKIKTNYIETIERRVRGIKVPIIMIGQRLHQDDIFSYIENAKENSEWKKQIITAIDDAGNARYPEVNPLHQLRQIKETKRYVFASQFQQNPIPSGGGLYRAEDFVITDSIPEILATFITADTSESEKEWNDKTVFSFWGLYQIKNKYVKMPDLYGLHWLDCVEENFEPKDLEAEFLDFWASCMRFKVQPQCAFIEKKSTGVTLISVLKSTQGLKVIAVERTVKSGSKVQRFIDMQQYIANKQISFSHDARHLKKCLRHMTDITANDTHRFDDIADTCYDAIKAAFIDKIIISQIKAKVDYNDIASMMTQGQRQVNQLRDKAYYGNHS